MVHRPRVLVRSRTASIEEAAALTAEAITALTAAVVLMLGAAFAIILAIIHGGAWLARKITDPPGPHLAPRYRPSGLNRRG